MWKGHPSLPCMNFSLSSAIFCRPLTDSSSHAMLTPIWKLPSFTRYFTKQKLDENFQDREEHNQPCSHSLERCPWMAKHSETAPSPMEYGNYCLLQGIAWGRLPEKVLGLSPALSPHVTDCTVNRDVCIWEQVATDVVGPLSTSACGAPLSRSPLLSIWDQVARGQSQCLFC